MRMFAPSDALLPPLIQDPSLKGFENPRITYAAILALLRELNGFRLLTLAYAIDALSKPLRPQILSVIYPA